MAIKRGRPFWARLFKEVEAGASQMTVAKRNGVSPSWLGKWCRVLREEGPSKGVLLPVRVVEGRPRRVELVVGNVLLAFEEGTDPEYVASVARALAA